MPLVEKFLTGFWLPLSHEYVAFSVKGALNIFLRSSYISPFSQIVTTVSISFGISYNLTSSTACPD